MLVSIAEKMMEKKMNVTDKFTHHSFLPVYDQILPKSGVKHFLEIGVQKGFSLQLWGEFFDEDCEIIGVDINPVPKSTNLKSNVATFVADAYNTETANNYFQIKNLT